MASWKKYFSAVPTQARLNQRLQQQAGEGGASGGSTAKYSSYLPEVYSGAPNRIERYAQYEQMDLDSEISKALDTISDFSTQTYETNDEPFKIEYKGSLTETEVTLLNDTLKQWCSLQKWRQRLWRMFRNTIKYGDQIFIRDPETFKLIWIDPTKVDKIIVNESKGKSIEQYVVRDLDVNLQTLVGTNMLVQDQYSFPGGYPRSSNPAAGSGTINYGQASTPGSRNSRFNNPENSIAVDASHVVHLSLSEGLDNQWPFGTSILESIYKVYKQKDLLEDSIIIYRIVRAPERRIFYIDVGSLQGPRAMQYVERIKNEIYQRRIPNRSGGGQCLALDTAIPLLDGRRLPLSEIIEEFRSGKENWVYSCDPKTGEMVPGPITWAGVTRKQTQVLRLTFDNGESVICTPDHKFPIFDKGNVEAKDLVVGQSMISFNTREKPITVGKKNTYQQIWDHSVNDWVWTHRMVGDYMRKRDLHETMTYLDQLETKTVIHHKNNDRYDNTPQNLAFMGKGDHLAYHRDTKKEYWDNLSDSERDRISKINSEITKSIWESKTQEEKLFHNERLREFQKKSVWMRKNDPIHAERYRISASKSRKDTIKRRPELKEKLLKNLENRRKLTNQSVILTRDMLSIVVEVVKKQTKLKHEAIRICDNDQRLIYMLRDNNPPDPSVIENKIDYNKWGYSKMNRLLRKFGYKNWKDFVSKAENFNHKLVSIEWLEDPLDTGTITVDGNEHYHGHHNFAITCGVVTCNSVIDAAYNPISINEDFFLATNSEGKGTRIETLAGGENLGQIDDLKYFNNKMIRGLGIPSSYLPTGADDGTAVYNDGKIGTAYIQEYRFSKYCQRLQNLMVPMLDHEFKMFLKQRGIEISSNLFELQFHPPQSFSQYRQMQIDGEQINVFSSLMQTEAAKYVSKRYALRRYLGWSEDEILENEKLWKEENSKKVKEKIGTSPADDDQVGLGSVGIRPSDTDLEDFGGEEIEGLEEPGAEAGAGEPAAEAPPPTPGGTAPPTI
jgi:hypothetical protein